MIQNGLLEHFGFYPDLAFSDCVLEERGGPPKMILIMDKQGCVPQPGLGFESNHANVKTCIK